MVPFAVTVLVLATVVQYILNYMTALLDVTGNQGASSILIGTAVGVLIAIVLFVGFLTQFRYGETFIAYVDAGLARVPGFGSIYESFREMSDVMMESDEQSFRDVKLVEFPHEGAYTLGFLTAESAGALQDAAGRGDLVTLFLPLAPNPVMGGHLVHVPSDRVMDVDMTVDEGIRTVVTSGVATGGSSDGAAGSGLSADELERIGATSEATVGAGVPVDERSAERQRRGTDVEDRRGAYESYAAPDSADEESVPSDVASYGDADTLGGGEDRPSDVGREREADTLGGDRETPVDVADAGEDGSLGREYDTPGDVDPKRVPVDDRWRDRRRDRDDDPTTDSPAEGSTDRSAREDAGDGGESSEFEDVERFERDREPSRGARRPDADAEGDGR